MSDLIKCEFPVDYVKGYHPNLLSWKELADLINIRPLMTEKRVNFLDPLNRRFVWNTHGWMKDKNSTPPSLIKDLLEEMVMYFVDCLLYTSDAADE